ncbi:MULTISPECIES: hypothetical protein [Enterobacter]|uniref:Lipoprotein n=2 Tax=Enterobacter asburiae TaxID=61645 RepID=A0ABC9UA89_ENTAS|nr:MULTISPECIES: hypothetical protein [Enterobacter]AZL63393.1 hypothetical protein EI562_10515 [Enterobacter asburiae]EHF5041543.1 hypothetical protein [Enterobacter asburiae]EMB8997719.1 hypothetical protein [Enterobacter asburiae]ESM32333.1 hypothetical protein L402_01955 [Enterobacter asburiae]MCK6902125.1 hypothetical protein [Enterobacter asburiae]
MKKLILLIVVLLAGCTTKPKESLGVCTSTDNVTHQITMAQDGTYIIWEGIKMPRVHVNSIEDFSFVSYAAKDKNNGMVTMKVNNDFTHVTYHHWPKVYVGGENDYDEYGGCH